MTNSILPAKKTKIVCTIGPASQSREILEKMIVSGMNVARLNFAHGDFDSHLVTINNIRAASVAVGRRVAIMGDLPGPKIRIGRLVDDPVFLVRGQSFILLIEEVLGDSQRASINFNNLPQVVKPGDKIFINDGFIQLEVEKVVAMQVHCQVLVGDELRSFNGVNLPGIDLGIHAFTDRDRECLEFSSEQRLDAVGQSFIQCPEDIEDVREAAREMDYYPFIVAKIERSRAVENLETILEVTDGIMVARGDLGVETPIEEIAITQKHIITQANLCGKPVITATHMLESMVHHTRPTRAEATDVANAILDGTDCIMLSGETAMGSFPVEAVSVMTRIAQVTEPYTDNLEVAKTLEEAKSSGDISTEDLISLIIFFGIEALNPTAVITPTLSGSTPRRISRFRPPVWIVAVSPNLSTCQNLQFSYGVFPMHEADRPVCWEKYARDWIKGHGLEGNLALLTQGTALGKEGGTNKLEVIDLSKPSSEVSFW